MNSSDGAMKSVAGRGRSQGQGHQEQASASASSLSLSAAPMSSTSLHAFPSTEHVQEQHSDPQASKTPNTPRRPKLSQRALSLFKRNKGHNGAPASLSQQSRGSTEQPRNVAPPEKLPYQPRLKPSPVAAPATPPNPQAAPSQDESAPTLQERLQSVMPSASNTNDPDPASANATPTQAHVSQLAQVQTPTSASSPRTPRPQIVTSSSSPQTPRIGHHHHHLHLRRLHPSRKAHADPNKSQARGPVQPQVNVPYVPGAFPVAPSYHEKAHPALQPPKLAFNLLDGPVSREQALAAALQTSETSSIAASSSSTSPSPKLAAALAGGDTLPPPRLQRPAIKVKIITWNMGGASLPKGDLEVLLGRVGGYVPPEADWDADVESDAEHGSVNGEEEEYESYSDGEDGTPAAEPQWHVSSYDEQQHDLSADDTPQTARPPRVRKVKKRRKAPAESKGKGVPGQENVPRHDRIPPLPHDDGHPYHLLVVAGQECPWGDGKRIATGLGVAGELSDLARTKTRTHGKPAKEFKDKDKETAISSSMPSSYDSRQTGFGDASTSAIAQTPLAGGFPDSVSQEFPFSSPPATAPVDSNGGASDKKGTSVPTPAHSKGFGGKGWSDMCEDWLCRGPAAQTQATKGLAATAEAVLHGSVASQDHSRASSPEPSIATGGEGASFVTAPTEMASSPLSAPEGIERQPATAAVGTSEPKSPPTGGLNLAARRLSAATSANTLSIPMPSFGRSNSSNSLSTIAAGQGTAAGSGAVSAQTPSPLPSPAAPIAAKDFALLPSPMPTPSKAPPVTSNLAKEKAKQQLHLQIPGNAQRDGTPQALGAYELIAKERCAMIYMAVYCWRGCRDRVRGVSRSHVKSGMLAGRVGNKGAVGISVKLGQSRLLFVNSHLAAHEGKVQTRLDNIAKIKRDLRVDTYLDAKDPRNRLEDVTEMFDHAFWFGDLNFRVDITRQHADWLVMQKRYDQALEFDQLRKVIKEGREFTGFQEHAIAFPPTYKYDVLKTLKKPKRERTVRRILHRRGHSATDVVTSPSALSDEPDVEGTANQTSMMTLGSPIAGGATIAHETVPELADETEEPDDDASSISSSAWDSFGSSGFATHDGSQNGRRYRQRSDETDSDEDSSAIASDSVLSSPVDPVTSNNTSAAQGPVLFSHGAAIKAKWKIMDLVRSATGSSNGSSHQQSQGGRERKHSQAGSSKRLSSQGERAPGAPGVSPSPSFGGPASASRGIQRSQSGNTIASEDDNEGASPRKERVIRHEPSLSSIDSVLFGSQTAEGGAGSGVAGDASPKAPRHERSLSAGGGDVTATSPAKSGGSGDLVRTLSSATQDSEADGEQQRYDTSAKQRVPSWTDRILWRSNVVASTESGHSEGLGSKMGKSFTNAMRAASASVRAGGGQQQQGRRGSQRPGSSGGDAGSVDAIAVPQVIPAAQGMPPRSKTFSHTENKTDTSEDGQHHRFRLLPHHRPRGSRSSSKTNVLEAETGTESPTSLRHAEALLDPTASTPPRATPRRTASVSTTPSSSNGIARRPTSTLQRDRSSPTLSALRVVSQPSRGQGQDGVNRDHARGESHDSKAAVASGTGNRFLSNWWSTHVPTILTAQGAVAALTSLTTGRDAAVAGDEDKQHQAAALPELIGPHKGQVECLLYKSLDDREMRALEGRSDHRPVIWVGSIGI